MTCPRCGRPVDERLVQPSVCWSYFRASQERKVGPDHPSQPWNQEAKK